MNNGRVGRNHGEIIKKELCTKYNRKTLAGNKCGKLCGELMGRFCGHFVEKYEKTNARNLFIKDPS